MADQSHLPSSSLKWPEVYSLAALSAAVAISWIAYHEYQPHLLEKFDLGDLAVFLIVVKGIVLVLIPPLAGWLSDLILRKNGKFFIIFSVGIGATAMVFMVVASIIGAGPLADIKVLLPYMIILWLVAMNIFISPAISMIDSFAPTRKLPMVVGFLFLVTELIYALEPLVVELVQFFGDTLTFIVGGILIAGTGYVFQRVSSDEVVIRRKKLMGDVQKSVSLSGYMGILLVGFLLGVGKAFLVEFIPVKVSSDFPLSSEMGGYLSFALLGFSAVLAYLVSGFVSRTGFQKVLPYSLLVLLVSVVFMLLAPSFGLLITAGILLATGFSFVNVSGLPYAIDKLSVRHITYGIGMFMGASNVVEGLLEYMYR